MRTRCVAVIAVLLLASCSTPVAIRFGPHARSSPSTPLAISNPSFSDGDPAAGRRAFIEMQCIDCHRVSEDPSLPRGRRAIAGPLLGGLREKAPQYVAERITSRSTGEAEELFDRTMKDYAQPMTARQLVDIVAYLRQRPPAGS
jgi:mono/diheme cytochrome c family protein